MEQKDFKLISPVDGVPLEGIMIFPEAPRGIVQLLHGMAEHKGRYLEFMKYLAEQGYVAVIHDHRGHGNCAVQGHFGGTGGDGLIRDARAVTEWVCHLFPGLPVYLFGHSMGSLVARCYLKRYDEALKGVLLCGTPWAEPAAIQAGLALIRLKTRLHGSYYRSDTVNNLVVGAFNRGIKNPTSPNQWISACIDNVNAYDRDPQCGFCFTLDGFRGLMELMQEAYSDQGWSLKNPHLPVHLLSGAEDPCHTGEKRFMRAVKKVQKMGYPVSWKLYPGMRHEILNEKEKAGVYRDIAGVLAGMEER